MISKTHAQAQGSDPTSCTDAIKLRKLRNQEQISDYVTPRTIMQGEGKPEHFLGEKKGIFYHFFGGSN